MDSNDDSAIEIDPSDIQVNDFAGFEVSQRLREKNMAYYHA